MRREIRDWYTRAIVKGDLVGMFNWEDEAFEDRCLDLRGKVRRGDREAFSQ